MPTITVDKAALFKELEREYRAVGLEPLAWYTDPDELFALSLTGPAT